MLALLFPGLGMGAGEGTPAVVQEPVYSGGWETFSQYDDELRSWRQRKKKRDQLLRELEGIQDEADREIAQLLHDSEFEQENSRQKARIKALVAEVSQAQVRQAFGQRVAEAHQRAQERATLASLATLVREAKRAQEEDFLLLAIMSIH